MYEQQKFFGVLILGFFLFIYLFILFFYFFFCRADHMTLTVINSPSLEWQVNGLYKTEVYLTLSSKVKERLSIRVLKHSLKTSEGVDL